MKFSEDIKQIIKEKFNNVDIYSLSLEELKDLYEKVVELKQEYYMLEIAMKDSGNAAYGAAANPFFYFYNIALAGDITGECQNLTKTMIKNLENFFHNTIWGRKDLWEKFDFALDESKKEWFDNQPVWIYSDTDSAYTTYGNFFECFTDEYKEKYKSDRAKLDWILKFNQEFLDDQNNKWCDEIYTPRHGKSVHKFELETVSKASINLKKKKYVKGLVFKKGVYYDKPKVSGTGIEIIKSTTPKLCRKILSDLINMLMFEYDKYDKKTFEMLFNQKVNDYRKKFYNAPVEDISQSTGVGNYKKYVIDDTNELIWKGGTPQSVKGMARFNYLAHKNGEDNLKMVDGKIKYYRIRLGKKKDEVCVFGFPSGQLPKWAPPMDKLTQWEKTVIDPINRFMEVMQMPLFGAGNATQLSLF